ncbi:FMN-binding glutamate synthase family protein [Streptomyces sp. NPDC008313]|uniref:FMN-binding glutamate synthase family protein n=1 Tax=Streptomyces sp. NPDC008313 TaxID=3364826 RepID=UPI0036DFE7B6
MKAYVTMAALCGLFLLGCRDRAQRRRPLLRVYPLIGRFSRLVVRFSRRVDPSSHRAGPFTSSDMRDIRTRALTGASAASFGSPPPPTGPARPLAADIAVVPVAPLPSRGVTLDGSDGRERLMAHLNFGAMGYGPVSANTIRAVALAAADVGCHQNTGEEGILGILGIHLDGGTSAPFVWQIGTGYWGCRDADGSFCRDAYVRTAALSQVDCIELKLSQGGKPGAGGMLPARKNTRSVARALGVAPFTDVVSPPQHSAFDSTESMLEHVALMTELSGGKPVGVKLCVGSRRSARALVCAIIRTGISPAFITVDGAEGGTGTSIRELQDHAGMPAFEALRLLHEELGQSGQRERVRLFVSGGVKNGFDLFTMLCLGADACFFTRAPLIAMGCVQARLCHTGTCPSGIAAQSLWSRSAVHPPTQGRQLAAYHRTVTDGLAQLMRACGRRTVSELDASCLIRPDGHPYS